MISIQKNLRSDHPILKKLKRGQEVTKAQRIHEADPSELIPLFTWFKTDKINPFPLAKAEGLLICELNSNLRGILCI